MANRCANCDRVFNKPLSKNAVYCDRLCRNEAERGLSPVCVCGTRFRLRGSRRYDKLRKFCSVRCAIDNSKPILRISKKYADRWAFVRTEVLRRDKFKCRRCQSVKNLDVHHIRKKSVFPDLKFALENLITLCRDCHLWVSDPNNKDAAEKAGYIRDRKTT